MRKIFEAICAIALIAPLLATTAEASETGRGDPGAVANAPGPILVAAAGPRAGGTAGPRAGGGGFRGGFRGGRFRGGGFRGGLFIGPSFGYYDPFFWPYGYGYGYGYYPPPVVVRERDYGPPPSDYLSEPDGPPPEQSWYHCANPEGYYPYVRSCDGPWQSVPVTPEGGPPPAR